MWKKGAAAFLPHAAALQLPDELLLQPAPTLLLPCVYVFCAGFSLLTLCCKHAAVHPTP